MRSSIPIAPIDPSKKEFLWEIIKESMTLMSNEWLRESELSSKPIQIISPSSSIWCYIMDQEVEALYNPIVRANNTPYSFVPTFLGSESLAPTGKIFKRRSSSLADSYMVLREVSVRHNDVKLSWISMSSKSLTSISDWSSHRETHAGCIKLRKPYHHVGEGRYLCPCNIHRFFKSKNCEFKTFYASVGYRSI